MLAPGRKKWDIKVGQKLPCISIFDILFLLFQIGFSASDIFVLLTDYYFHNNFQDSKGNDFWLLLGLLVVVHS